MNKYVIVMEYDSTELMDIKKIDIFYKNLKTVESKGNKINLVLYGKILNEELAVCMSYLNKLMQNMLCEIAISTKTKEIIIIKNKNDIYEGGANHQSVKLSDKNIKELKNKNFEIVLKKYYKDAEIKCWPTKNWESTILEIIGE